MAVKSGIRGVPKDTVYFTLDQLYDVMTNKS
jgi:hypothetical protein